MPVTAQWIHSASEQDCKDFRRIYELETNAELPDFSSERWAGGYFNGRMIAAARVQNIDEERWLLDRLQVMAVTRGRSAGRQFIHSLCQHLLEQGHQLQIDLSEAPQLEPAAQSLGFHPLEEKHLWLFIKTKA